MKYKSLLLILALMLLQALAFAEPPLDSAIQNQAMNYVTLEAKALQLHPILKEKQLEIEKTEQKLKALEMAAILPKFQTDLAVGPAPGLNNVRDTSGYALSGIDSFPVTGSHKDYDFRNWGPYFGVEFSAVQPLNFARYNAGHRAASYDIKISEAQFQKEKMDVSEEAQKLYFSHVYARMILSILQSAGKELDKAQNQLQKMLDDGDDNVKQTDLLELKAGRYALLKAQNEADVGVQRSLMGLAFLIQIPESTNFVAQDTALFQRKEALPSLDTLKQWTLKNHPDLQRLKNGLAAREELLTVAKGELGPDIFLFGNFKYTKAWSSDRQSGGGDPFASDPLNELTAVAGLGLRFHLNVWDRYQNYRKEKIALTQLQRTEAYAAKGLLLKTAEAYVQYLSAKKNVEESQKSLRAAEAWLKAAAMKYDLDPTLAKDMLSPYKTSLYAKKDFYEAVLEYNLAVSKVIKAVGWTLTDYFHSLNTVTSAQ